MPDALKATILDDFFRLNACCRRREFCEKTYAMYTTKEAIASCAAFTRAIKVMSHKFCFTDMVCERLLAAVRNACDDGVEVEKICSAGYCNQLLTQHRLNGGADPRCVTRSQLLEDGVELRCSFREGGHDD